MPVVENKTHKRVQHARNTTAVMDAYIGLDGEIVIDTMRKELRLHDGQKKGGWRFLSSSAMATLFLSVDSEAGNIRFTGSGQFGFLARTADKVYKTRELKVEDGLRISNPKGIEGNPSLGLPKRLKPISTDTTTDETQIQNADTIVESGLYGLKANAQNTPVGIFELTSSVLIVIARSTTEVVQFVCNAATGQNVWTRAMIAGSWQAWAQLRPDSGTVDLLTEGTDVTQRTWTAAQLNEFITDRLKDIGTESVGGTVSMYGTSQRKFKERHTGPAITDKTYGPYGTPTDEERWIIYCGLTGRVIRQGNSSGTDRGYGGDLTVSAELDGDWVKIYEIPNQDGMPLPSRTPPAKNVTLRIQYDSAGGSEVLMIHNSDWVTLGSFAGVWSGKLRFATSTNTMEMSLTGYKFKLKT